MNGRLFYSQRVGQFMPRFEFPQYKLNFTDFKGHQRKAIKKIKNLLPQINLLVELRDVRAPLSTRNIFFDKLILSRGTKLERLVVYTKRDLIFGNNTQENNLLMEKLTQLHQVTKDKFIVIDGKQSASVKNLLDVINWRKETLLANANAALPLGYKVLVSGMPNVGKSTLINTIRLKTNGNSSRKVAKTGNEAGVTRSTSELIRISSKNDSSPVYLVDTPGIGIPGRLSHDISRMVPLALCNCIKSNAIDPVIQADYLLYLINLHPLGLKERYIGQFEAPTNDIYEVLNRYASSKQLEDIDNQYTNLALAFIKGWNNPTKGKYLLENRMGLFFDPEMLLEPGEFDYKEYISNIVQKLDNFDWFNEESSARRASQDVQNINQLF